MENYTKDIEISKNDFIKALTIAIDYEVEKNKRYFIYKDTVIITKWKEVLNNLNNNKKVIIK